MSVMDYEEFEGVSTSIKWIAVLKTTGDGNDKNGILAVGFLSGYVYKYWNIGVTNQSSPLEILKNFRRLKKNGKSIGGYYSSIKSSLGGYTKTSDKFDSFNDFHNATYGTPWEKFRIQAHAFPIRSWIGKRVKGW